MRKLLKLTAKGNLTSFHFHLFAGIREDWGLILGATETDPMLLTAGHVATVCHKRATDRLTVLPRRNVVEMETDNLVFPKVNNVLEDNEIKCCYLNLPNTNH